MQREMDFSNLTAEQLAYVRSLEGEIGERDETISAQREEIRLKDATISSQASEIDAKDKAIASKDAEIREKDEIIREILKTLNVERSIVRRLNLERFVTKKDCTSQEKVDTSGTPFSHTPYLFCTMAGSFGFQYRSLYCAGVR